MRCTLYTLAKEPSPSFYRTLNPFKEVVEI